MRLKGRLQGQPRGPNFKGVIAIAKMSDGTLVARSWPKKTGPAKTPVNKLNNSTFTQTVELIKNPVDKDMISAVSLSKGTDLLWRDILMMCAMGTLFRFRLLDGTLLYGGRIMSQEIQNMLDTISNVPGVILGRTGNGWQALLPGPAGWVLTSQGDGSPPLYQPASGGGGGGTNGLTLIRTITITSALTEIDLSTIFSSTYTKYQIEIAGLVNSTSAIKLCLQLGNSISGTWQTSAVYYFGQTAVQNGGTIESSGSSAITYGILIDGLDAIANRTSDITMRINNPLDATINTQIRSEISWSGYGGFLSGTNSIITVDTAAYDSIKLFPTSGTLTAGQITIYGLA